MIPMTRTLGKFDCRYFVTNQRIYRPLYSKPSTKHTSPSQHPETLIAQLRRVG